MLYTCIYDDIHIIFSVIATPADSIGVKQRGKRKSCRLSYQSSLGAASRLCSTTALTARRLNTSRKAPKSHNISVSHNEHYVCSVNLRRRNFNSFFFVVKGEHEPRASGVADENRVEAVLCDSPLPVPTHSAEELLQAARCIYCCREPAGLGSGGGGTAQQFQGLFLCAAGDGGDRR